jgi:hypothetical protein
MATPSTGRKDRDRYVEWAHSEGGLECSSMGEEGKRASSAQHLLLRMPWGLDPEDLPAGLAGRRVDRFSKPGKSARSK